MVMVTPCQQFRYYKILKQRLTKTISSEGNKEVDQLMKQVGEQVHQVTQSIFIQLFLNLYPPFSTMQFATPGTLSLEQKVPNPGPVQSWEMQRGKDKVMTKERLQPHWEGQVSSIIPVQDASPSSIGQGSRILKSVLTFIAILHHTVSPNKSFLNKRILSVNQQTRLSMKSLLQLYDLYSHVNQFLIKAD